MGHEHDRACAAVVERLQQREDLARRAAVEVPGRLVGEQDLRVVGERARDRHALLFAARELLRPVRLPAAEADLLEQVACAAVAIARAQRRRTSSPAPRSRPRSSSGSG